VRGALSLLSQDSPRGNEGGMTTLIAVSLFILYFIIATALLRWLG